MWLSKEKTINPTLKRLAGFINHYNCSNLVSLSESTFYITPLPFYSDFNLITFIDLSFSPYLEIRLLDNGEKSIILDGTPQPFYEVNAISPLQFTEKNVFQYAMLVLGNTQKNDNSYRLVTSIDDIYFSQEPTKEQYQLIESSIRTTKVKHEEGSYKIKTTLLFDDTVAKVVIRVFDNGKVEIAKEKLLLNNMPIRELVLD
ncbi:MAG TPA: hypothetical protein DIW31_05805 [Bacteroidales bacterium]|nr:hypothetical protein [Bacteroidales bacterium]